ncbi:MAG: CDP-alcohol phosphatidyltransferase family protein [Candidatus Caldarchaeum sp.]
MALGRRGRGFFEKAAAPVVNGLAKTGISPNSLTVLGLLLTGTSLPCYWLARETPVYFVLAALALALGGFLDGLDGLVARTLGKQTAFGAFLDSFTDRISDSLVAAGFMLSGAVDPYLALTMLTAMMLVSYARARAESLNVELKNVGIGERAVRIIAAILGTLLAFISPSILFYTGVFITAVSIVTVAQRFIAVSSALSGKR